MPRLVPRAQPSRALGAASPLLALAFTVAFAAMLFAAFDKDVALALRVLLIEPWNGIRAVTELLLKATPLILIALGLALCFRSNVWNIGAEGQYLIGGTVAGGLAMWLTTEGVTMSPFAFLPLAIAAGAVGGAAWAAIVALLRDRFSANEILVSLMLVYVADQLLSWLVFGPWKDPRGFNMPQTVTFDVGIPRLITGYRLNWGFVIALLGVAAMWLFMARTYRGFAMQVGGLAPAAARYAGFSARGALWLALLTSGALAGVAAALDVTGPVGQLTPYVSLGYGFTAIIVAFVGRLHPLGCALAALLLSTFLIGGELLQSRVGLPAAMSGVFQGVLLITLLACDTLIHYRIQWRAPQAAAAATARAAA